MIEGLAPPKLYILQLAAYILLWMRNCSDIPMWKILDMESVGSTSLAVLLCSKLTFAQHISSFTNKSVVSHSIKIWKQFRNSFNFNNLSLAAAVETNAVFTPSVMDDCRAIILKITLLLSNSEHTSTDKVP